MVELINREMEEDQRYWNLNHLINKVLVKQLSWNFFMYVTYHDLFDLYEVFPYLKIIKFLSLNNKN